MLVLHDKATLLHHTVEVVSFKLIKALECPERVEVIVKALENDAAHSVQVLDTTDRDNELTTERLLDKILLQTHDTDYLTHLRTIHENCVSSAMVGEDESVLPECFNVPALTFGNRSSKPPKDLYARTGYYAFDMSTGICKETWTSAVASAGLALEAARLLVQTDASQEQPRRNVLALCRPPGHHCTTKMAGGYCYLNNSVVAVQALRHFRLQATSTPSEPSSLKVAILDLDFHHGNGTQFAFYQDPSVLYVSIHGQDEYPYYSGHEDEIGDGPGTGFNLNLPLAVKAPLEEYLAKLKIATQRIRDFQPQYLVVSLGFDTFHLDPLGNFGVDASGYEAIARTVRESDGLHDIPAAILLEGGYVVEHLGPNMLSFLKGWEQV
jgi:acetoin utilization deacetylase AcuC-like enzyme